MADIPTSQFQHYCSEIDAAVDEVIAARGSEASLSARLAAIVSDFEYDQDRQEAEIGVVANAGAKNLLKITGTTTSSNGITYTLNQDGTVTVTGTATANSFFTLGSMSGYTGDVILSGCPANGGDGKWRLYKAGTNPSQSDTGNGVTYTLDGTSNNYSIEIYNGQEIADGDPLIFRPMIRPAAITDPTYEPYAPTNRELYEDLQTKVTLAKVFGRGVGISNNDDLNTYQALGRYCASNGTIAASLSNCPVTTGFILTVTESFQVNGGIVQTIETLVSGETQVDIYKRMRIYRNNAWSWGDWYKFEGTAVSTQSAPASLMQTGRIDAELTDAGAYDTLSMQPETLTNGTTEMSGAEQDETESREEER